MDCTIFGQGRNLKAPLPLFFLAQQNSPSTKTLKFLSARKEEISLMRHVKSKPRQIHVNDRRSVCQYVLVLGTHLGPKTRFLLLSDSCGFVYVGALSDERAGLTYSSLCNLGTDLIENTISNSPYLVACVSVTAVT
jgi:hypothetical protein